MKKLLIFGTGGMARETHQIVEDINRAAPALSFLGFLDGNEALHGTQVHGCPVLGGLDWLDGDDARGASIVVALGNTALRRKIVGQIRARSAARFATLIHPRAWVGNRVTIGEGSIICAGSMLTTDIALGCHVIVNIGSALTHDVVAGDYVTVAPTVNVSGAVRIGEGADLGSGCTVIQGKSIGAWSTLGAGAVVVHDVGANETVVGVPARAIKTRRHGWHLDTL